MEQPPTSPASPAARKQRTLASNFEAIAAGEELPARSREVPFSLIDESEVVEGTHFRQAVFFW